MVAATHLNRSTLEPTGRVRAAPKLPFLSRIQMVKRRRSFPTLGDMRASGVRGLLVYCSDYRCSHSMAISGDRWADDVRLSDLEPLFTCTACGTKGADVRPDFNWNKQDALARGF